ncbi:MAG: carcinine hydrolase/isopenicillin-N N-acyltransferase family protein [Legionellaceae bacterium]|nr:carcinine hydrolase/isopenicillin-N N-acyltransferase family protein [Legionellaceae bacterium]
MKKIILTSVMLFAQIGAACTGFGIITDHGTLIGKNRDYFYGPQKFGLILPLKKLDNWQGNLYHHHNQFYALTAKSNQKYELSAKVDLSMGVNQAGLTAIEEDTFRPSEIKKQRMFYQPYQGIDVNTLLYGVLQNFNTIDEMIPFLSKIFSVAAPDFYQFSDAKKVLTVEVAFGKNNKDPKRAFTYKIISKKNAYTTHTNAYVSPKFTELNKWAKPNSLAGAQNRLTKITNLISQAKERNIAVAPSWFLNTSSRVSKVDDKNWCQNTSLFRSNLKGLTSIDTNVANDKVGGTVSSMIVENNGDFKQSYLYLKMVESVTTLKNHDQLIKYKVLHTSLAKLFSGEKLVFVPHEFVRKAPVKGVCS